MGQACMTGIPHQQHSSPCRHCCSTTAKHRMAWHARLPCLPVHCYYPCCSAALLPVRTCAPCLPLLWLPPPAPAPAAAARCHPPAAHVFCQGTKIAHSLTDAAFFCRSLAENPHPYTVIPACGNNRPAGRPADPPHPAPQHCALPHSAQPLHHLLCPAPSPPLPHLDGPLSRNVSTRLLAHPSRLLAHRTTRSPALPVELRLPTLMARCRKVSTRLLPHSRTVSTSSGAMRPLGSMPADDHVGIMSPTPVIKYA